MYVTTPTRKGNITVVRLVHGYRKDGKVKIKTIKTLGQSRDPKKIEHLKKKALKLKKALQQGIPLPASPSPTDNVPLSRLRGKKIQNDGVLDILGTSYKHLRFQNLISHTRKNKVWNQILKYCVFARFLEPTSKLSSVQLIQSQWRKTCSHDQILRMMDHLSKQEKQIKKQLLQTVLEKSQNLQLMLFDVTTLYFENVTETDLKQFGFSKDGKFKEVQIVLALLTDGDGLPITYEVFPGNTAEAKTMILSLNTLKNQHNLKKICVTADRAMFSKANFAYFESQTPQKLVISEYIVACPLKKLAKEHKEKILDKSNYIKIDADKSSFEFLNEGRRYVVVFSKKRAGKDKYDREKILEKARSIANEKGEIATDKLSQNRGIKRYLEKSKGFVKIKKQAIAEDEKWDGIFGLCTNIQNQTAKELFSSYKRLWKIEESFRINKHTLKMRPIFHQLSKRIKAHILICFLTYTLLRYLELFLKNKGLPLSHKTLIDTLSSAQSHVSEDAQTGWEFATPQGLSQEGKQIYKAFGITHPTKPYRLFGPKTLI